MSAIDTPQSDAYIFRGLQVPAQMSSTPFGAHLKREREMRGVSLEEVSAATRISTRFLEAIENEHWDLLPGGVFNRGFIRSVARFLGLDEDSMVAEYSLETRGRVDAGVVPDPPMEMPRDWKPVVLATAVVILILASGAFVYARYGGRIVAHFHKKPAATEGPAASVMPSAAPSSSNGASTGTASVVPDPGAQNSVANSGTASDPLELKVETSKAVSVMIVADGKTVFNGALEASESKQFEARETLEVTASESSAVILELNGQPVAAFGQPGLPGTIKLTRNDLKTPAGDSH
ncbi:MAG: helix-turn-helix domain-containing protein [Candidatus Acidiferrales bacterium]